MSLVSRHLSQCVFIMVHTSPFRKQYGRVMKNPWNDRRTFLVRMKIVSRGVSGSDGPTMVTRYVMPSRGTMMIRALAALRLTFCVW